MEEGWEVREEVQWREKVEQKEEEEEELLLLLLLWDIWLLLLSL
jgi:hypothetical protein